MKKDKQPVITSYRLEDILVVPGMKIDVHYKMTGKGHHHAHVDLTQAHRHEYYTLAVSGNQHSRHMVDFRQVNMPPHSVFLLSPWQVHLPQDVLEAADIYLISFTPDFLPPGAPALPVCMEKALTPDADAFKEIWWLCAQLLREFNERKALQEQVLQHYLAVLLTLFTRYLPENAASNPLQPVLLRQYRSLMEIHLLSWSSCGDYAKALHVTADHLNEVVKQETGQTASALLAARRILEAKRMLLHSTHGIKEIAWYLQFNEVTYFNRFFKQHTGETPLAFRISNREKYNYNPE
ncbi:helix-turn-helix domain-containing protein [Chitinophaga sp. 22321]|uniref:AraC family transcriptional regulator n=1 Tax=Chitinophaga hostae TaxID=2831022 RepID=A0ABS5J8Y9_9BACT|nr:helix-turn-helix domain-containing protein [Chitinophaga hostae]MBS0031681.1 AraC family transcriptional regulator [Chitinophaga hostae]